MRAAQLNDSRFEAEVRKSLEEGKFTKPKKYRPPWEGFSEQVEAMYDLSDDIRLLIKAMTQSDIPFRPRPESPTDRVKAELKALGLKKIQEMLNEDATGGE